MKVISSEDLQALKLFTVQAGRLYNSRFVQSSLENKKISLQFRFDASGNFVEKKWPDEDEINGFILPFRFLIQDNERCSWRNISSIYESLDIPETYKSSFKEARQNLNKWLDSDTTIKLKEPLTRREIIETFIYGYYAHSNKFHREKLEEWRKIPIVHDFIEFEFIHILHVISGLTYRMSEQVNKEVIKILEESS